MNNGKVRIYELSKELNLDNKDILAICDQLNISVKSHSSTITESQAELIRAGAERYVPASTNGKNKDGAKSSGGASNSPNSKAVRPKKKHKQEILEIRKQPKLRNASKENLNAKEGDTSSSAQLAPPPHPSAKLQPSPSSEQGKSKSSTQQLKPPSSPQEVSQIKAKKEPSEKQEISSQSEEASAQLIGPPPRPKRDNRRSVRVEKPVPKKPKISASSSVQTEKLSPKSATVKIEKETPVPVLPKLQKPNLPKPPQSKKVKQDNLDSSDDKDSTDNFDEAIGDEVGGLEKSVRKQPKLKRPTPRPAKRKEWEEEEEEIQENKNKASKAAAKKRRSLIIEEDDDDLNGDKDKSLIPMVASMSVARPPKPKSLTKQTSPSRRKEKKPAAPSRGGNKSAAFERKQKKSDRQVVEELPELITLSNNLTLRELADLLNTPETDIIKQLFSKGVAVNITETLEIDTAKMVAEELGVLVEIPEETSAATKVTEMVEEGDKGQLQHRPPVVTIMGHVDHGKTTLLDAIRKTKVAEGEAGGITQHIGAYHVDVEHNGADQQVVFLDTPGHEAFTAMRARGARVTDIAILVVAADDGVQPQTREAISHAKAAGVPIVVAVNKVDKAGAEPDRVKQELTEHGLVPEEWGGDTIMVPVSAIKGENLNTLLEMILLVSEIEELSANPDRLAKGTVIEANLDKSRGPVATLLVQNGTLQVGDPVVAGSTFGKIRAMIDDRGERVEKASPSFAVEILGMGDVPAAGDEFEAFASEKEARAVADKRSDNKRESRLQKAMSSRRVTLGELSAKAQEGELKELNLILKADVQGSVEAILGTLQQLPQNEVQVRVLFSAPGEITETDVDLAAASGAIVIGFNTTLASGARQAADREGVYIREYDIIYKLLDDIQGAMEGLLDPEEVEEHLGQTEVRAVFQVGRGSVAGCYVQSGKVVRNCRARVRRRSEVVYEGSIDSLKRMKDDVKEVNAGFECGINIDKFNSWQEGDIIETYQMVTRRRTLAAK